MTKLDHLSSWHSDWSEVKAIVYGLGISGFSVADTLNELGSKVLVISDSAEAEVLDILDVLGVETIIGKTQEEIDSRSQEFEPDLVITSPGIRPDNQNLVNWSNAGVEIWSDIDLAWRVRDKSGKASEWICITGTNGKTTTTQLVEQMLLAAGINAVACGNIGVPILDVVRDPANFEVLVVEISSFQLHYLNKIEPISSAVLNIAEDHLDWHGSMDEYSKAKGKIYHNTKVCCVYNVGDKKTISLLDASMNTDSAQAVGFTVNSPAPNEVGWVEDLLVDRAFIDDPGIALELASMSDLENIKVISPHLMANIAAAASLARSVGVQPQEISKALKGFKLDAHRIELVKLENGISWVDDSKATNPHAAAAALSAFDSVIWIVGGLLKGVDISDLVSNYSSRVKAAIVIGVDRAPVLEAFLKESPETTVYEIDSEPSEVMNQAVRIARELAVAGDVVLLAPAAASMDQFKDYAHRGDLFVAAVNGEE